MNMPNMPVSMCGQRRTTSSSCILTPKFRVICLAILMAAGIGENFLHRDYERVMTSLSCRWAYTGTDYGWQSGKQMTFVKSMIDHIAGW